MNSTAIAKVFLIIVYIMGFIYCVGTAIWIFYDSHKEKGKEKVLEIILGSMCALLSIGVFILLSLLLMCS